MNNKSILFWNCPGVAVAIHHPQENRHSPTERNLVHRKYKHGRIVNIETNSIEKTTILIEMGVEKIRLTAAYTRPYMNLNIVEIIQLLYSPIYTIVARYLNAKHIT